MPSQVKTNYQLFKPIDYLKEYYYMVDPENEQLLQFFADVARDPALAGATVLDFGCGPTIYAMISLARVCSAIHMSDYQEANLHQVRWWLEEDARAHDWTPFLRYALECEATLEPQHARHAGHQAIAPRELQARSALLRQKVTQLIHGDARAAHPVGPSGQSRYDVLVSAFCLEAAATDLTDWKLLLGNLSTVLKPGGLLVYVTLVDSPVYRIGEDYYAAVSIPQQALIDAFVDTGYNATSIRLRRFETSDPTHMYKGFIMSTARKREDRA